MTEFEGCDDFLCFMTNFNVENRNVAKDKGYEVGGQCAVVVLLHSLKFEF